MDHEITDDALVERALVTIQPMIDAAIERALLLAVARAAKRMVVADDRWCSVKDEGDAFDKASRECVAAENGLRDALAALPPDLLADTP